MAASPRNSSSVRCSSIRSRCSARPCCCCADWEWHCGFGAARGYKFWLLVTASTLGGMLMVASAGFATLFLGIELLSLPAFALIVHGQGRSTASEGAFKYLVLSSVASALVLFGISIAYGLSGTLLTAAWASDFAYGGLQAKAAGLLVIAGLFLKAAVFPFHAWAPDAYASARLPVTALMASLVKAAVVLALARILANFPLDAASVAVVTGLAIVSIVFGNVAALGQGRFKRLLAYSSVAHAGYMIFALIDTTGSRASDLLWYTAFYGLATVLACASFAALSPDGNDDLRVLEGKFATQPVASILLAIAVLSLAGLPPLPGFFAKLFVFKSVIASGYLVPAVIAFVGSFLGLAYYVGIVMRLFQAAPAAGRARTSAGSDADPRPGRRLKDQEGKHMTLGQVEIPPLQGTVADMLAFKGTTIHAVAPDATVYDAIAKMDERRVGALLVMRGEQLVGVISERDYTRKVILLGRASKETQVAEIMSSNVISVRPDMSLGECLKLVTDRGIRHLPVVENDKVVGLLSIGDLVRAVVAQQAETISSLKSFIGSDYPT